MSREKPQKRKYELKKRAAEMAETHERITEAAIELHGSVGPSRTTMSAVAERAGVERRTLYRHFPTEADLFAACSTHYFAANPGRSRRVARCSRSPSRTRAGPCDSTPTTRAPSRCSATSSARELVDFARQAVAPLNAYLDEGRRDPANRRNVRGRRRQLIGGALRHALAFLNLALAVGHGVQRWMRRGS